ncbi:hypothetical protein PTKIN_Ptkin01aG0335400 [Pterospermum kingtungense]
MPTPSSLLQSNALNLKRYCPLHLHPPTHTHPPLSKFSGTLTSQPQGFPKLYAKCFFFPEKKMQHLTSSDLTFDHLSSCSDDENPFHIIAETILKALNTLKKPAIAAVLLGLLLMCDPNSTALAASGGRMGGSSRSSSSRNGRSRSSSHSSSSSRNTRSSFSSYSFRGRAADGVRFDDLSDSEKEDLIKFFLMVFVFVALVVHTVIEKTSTVLKLQVALLGVGRPIQTELNRIAEVANTSTPEGLSFVLTESIQALFRHPDYCISGYSSVDVKWDIDEGEKHFNQLSIEERRKFDEETLVNVNNIKRKSPASQKASGLSNDYIVVTILVAAQGMHKLARINGSGALKEALQKLASIPTSEIQAVEVLWTPQNESDTLSEQELLEDYPLLKPL